MRFPEEGCTVPFRQVAAGLAQWIEAHDLHLDLTALISAYINRRGEVLCVECARGYSTMVQEFTALQDLIRWGNSMMGMIYKKLMAIQSHLWVRGSTKLPGEWAVGCITQLLQITDSWWIYWCILVHDPMTGLLVNQHKAALLENITRHLSMEAKNLMEVVSSWVKSRRPCNYQWQATGILLVSHSSSPWDKPYSPRAACNSAGFQKGTLETSIFLHNSQLPSCEQSNSQTI